MAPTCLRIIVRRLTVAFALAAASCLVPAVAGEVYDGHRDYLHHCATCHGALGRGDGPAAAALTDAPGDLTRLGANNGGSFPETLVYRVLDGRATVSAHGTREMPVWGNRFAAAGNTDGDVDARISQLIRFIETLQVPGGD